MKTIEELNMVIVSYNGQRKIFHGFIVRSNCVFFSYSSTYEIIGYIQD